jgi:TetR/AcrR family transcriptional repressor of nem operon
MPAEDDSDPRERLKALVASWVDQRDVAARYGCPSGTLAAEIGKRADGTLDAAVGQVVRQLLNWAEEQFRQLGQPDPADLAVMLIAAYQGMSLLASALRDPWHHGPRRRPPNPLARLNAAVGSYR